MYHLKIMPLHYFWQEKYTICKYIYNIQYTICILYLSLFVSLPPFPPECELTDVIDCIENLGNWPLGPCN